MTSQTAVHMADRVVCVRHKREHNPHWPEQPAALGMASDPLPPACPASPPCLPGSDPAAACGSWKHQALTGASVCPFPALGCPLPSALCFLLSAWVAPLHPLPLSLCVTSSRGLSRHAHLAESAPGHSLSHHLVVCFCTLATFFSFFLVLGLSPPGAGELPEVCVLVCLLSLADSGDSALHAPGLAHTGHSFSAGWKLDAVPNPLT